MLARSNGYSVTANYIDFPVSIDWDLRTKTYQFMFLLDRLFLLVDRNRISARHKVTIKAQIIFISHSLFHKTSRYLPINRNQASLEFER